MPPDTDTSPDNPRHAEQLTLAVAIVRRCFPDAAEPSREDPMVTWIACLFEKYGRGERMLPAEDDFLRERRRLLGIAACGPRMQHFTSQCREYVHAAKESYKRDVVVLRGQVADLRSMLGGLALMIKHRSCCDGEDARTTPEAKSAVELALATVKRTGGR